MNRVQQELATLGDPSGRQDADYWDSWFRVVCVEQDHRPFEWYCEPEEVLRVVSSHLITKPSSSQPRAGHGDKLRMIHPGSGTSMLPLVLNEKLDGFEQVVVDVSQTAIHEMQNVHGRSHGPPVDDSDGNISYVATDLLNPPMPFQNSSFVSWIDKGFVDAIFSKDCVDQSEIQSLALFEEANRLLVPNKGFMLIVSLAEEHSLQIIVGNFLSCRWTATIHVWEMEPISGNIRPFGFVLIPADNRDGEPMTAATARVADVEIVWHSSTSNESDEEEEEPVVYKVSTDHVHDKVAELISRSRDLFQVQHFDDKGLQRFTQVHLEIKPVDTEVDLSALSSRIRSMRAFRVGDQQFTVWWRQLLEPTQNIQTHVDKIVPIGFGVYKLLLCCVVPSEHVDDLSEVIETEENLSVQSVDVDWTQTFPVRNTKNMPHPVDTLQSLCG